MSHDSVPSPSEFGELIAYMSSQWGITAQAAQDIIGTSPNGRTRQEIADDLRAWLKDRPKA